MNTRKAEQFRVSNPLMGDSKKGDQFGCFFIPETKSHRNMIIICAPTDEEWQHVSVSLPDRCPTWQEMCFVKDLFWDEEEIAFQFHPAKSQYVNNHPYCLHLWSHKSITTPPTNLVGVK